MSIYKDDIKYQIAQKLFEYYVMNDKYVAVQMPDGKYIPKRITSTPVLFRNMLESGASLGMYQQQYGRKWIKWICLDFDCKEPCMLPNLVEKYVLPAVMKLKELEIQYLAEFSGRRGIHIWIFTKGIITKAQGFKIAERLTESYRASIRCETEFGLDLFPAIAGGGMKLGKQVKLPLSVHRKGGQSFFIPDILNLKYHEWINLPEHPEFWEIQLKILQECVLNNPEELWEKLKLSPDQEQREKALLYKKEYVISGKKISLEEMKENCTECSVFSSILQRALDGNLRYLDRLILAGCLGHFQDKELILDIMRQQKNYKEEVTKQYLSKLGKSYYPVTIQYMYDLYGEKPEPDLNPQMTILEYIADGNDSTLHYLYEKFEHIHGERSYLSWAFDEGKIKRYLKREKHTNIILWHGKPLKKIIFMVDNLMKGGSLRNMLNFHLAKITDKEPRKKIERDYLNIDPTVKEMLDEIPGLKIEIHPIFGFKEHVKEIETEYQVKIVIHREIPKSFCSDDETIGLVQELYGTKVNKGICCVFRYNNLPAKNVLPEYVCDYKKRAGLFQRSADLE